MSKQLDPSNKKSKIINVDTEVVPIIGHYSHVVKMPNGFVFLSGQKAWINSDAEICAGGVKSQVDQIFKNVRFILEGINMEIEDICRISCHLAEIEDYAEFNQAYSRNLGDHKPARTVLGGYSLRGGALVELVIEAYSED